MNFSVVILFSLTLLLGLTAMLLAGRLYHRGRRVWLRHYLAYVSTFCILEFLNLVAVLITRSSLQGFPPELIRRAEVAVYIVVLPLGPLPIFFLLQAALGLCGRTLPRRIRLALASVYVAVILWEAGAAGVFLSMGDHAPIMYLGRKINSSALILFFAILAGILACSAFRHHRSRRIGAGGFALLTLTGFTAYAFFPELFPGLSQWSLRTSLRILIFFLQLIPPTLWLLHWQPRFQPHLDPLRPAMDDLPVTRLTARGITEREREVIALVVRGFSNRQIEEHLFISLSTVKNHLYNIFRKLKVSSRMQLIQALKRISDPDEH